MKSLILHNLYIKFNQLLKHRLCIKKKASAGDVGKVTSFCSKITDLMPSADVFKNSIVWDNY